MQSQTFPNNDPCQQTNQEAALRPHTSTHWATATIVNDAASISFHPIRFHLQTTISMNDVLPAATLAGTLIHVGQRLRRRPMNPIGDRVSSPDEVAHSVSIAVENGNGSQTIFSVETLHDNVYVLPHHVTIARAN
jgi:hypothetical protein